MHGPTFLWAENIPDSHTHRELSHTHTHSVHYAIVCIAAARGFSKRFVNPTRSQLLRHFHKNFRCKLFNCFSERQKYAMILKCIQNLREGEYFWRYNVRESQRALLKKRIDKFK